MRRVRALERHSYSALTLRMRTVSDYPGFDYTIDNIDYVTWIGNSTGSSILNVRA